MRTIVVVAAVLALGAAPALGDGGGGAPSGTAPKSTQAGQRSTSKRVASVRTRAHRAADTGSGSVRSEKAPASPRSDCTCASTDHPARLEGGGK